MKVEFSVRAVTPAELHPAGGPRHCCVRNCDTTDLVGLLWVEIAGSDTRPDGSHRCGHVCDWHAIAVPAEGTAGYALNLTMPDGRPIIPL